ncbi:arp2/3 complex 21 kDa subunit [Cryptococcus bacillisporus CA1873]|uniref:Actin-related protein 2/3 complex subunit 3 n=1 Tax=Cryptococcus bacillisporus CA1873 TaxID=1296111 RepID=A0ABR5BA47_CRYGA|nr:arp2/3 complex 21 kDa subunit [Cryptococcus bacillisporus CA1873]|eukprot:KIR60459.1 arp2/3 complex 21 kDa subunit [Cryptococcus gattii CA1873]
MAGGDALLYISHSSYILSHIHAIYHAYTSVRQVGNTAILPITTKIRGPAPLSSDPSQPDIIEESLDLFRANCLFRNFEIKGPADRLLIYLILFISDCLTKLAPTAGKPSPSYQEATKVLQTLSVDNFALPGDAGFPLNSLYHPPASRVDADHLRSYLTQTRCELALRLCDRLYPHEQVIGPDEQPTGQLGPRATKPSKWWMSFQKRRFMGRSLGV